MSKRRRLVLVPLLSACLMMAAVPAFSQTTQVPFEQLVSKLSWRNIGPSVGGRSVAVAGVPGQPNIAYGGTVGGGLYKSTDYGLTWHNISDGTMHTESDSIGAVAVAPSDPQIIYAGTGEADIRNTFITGNGVYKSTDAGKTWKYVGLKDTWTTSVIRIDPRDPNIVYVASMGHVTAPNDEGGVYKSTDGGQTWKKILSTNDKSGAIDISLDPQNPDILYAAMWQGMRTASGAMNGGPGSGLYKSTDGGAHWTNISRNSGMPEGTLGRIGVAIAPSQPNTVYAIIVAKHGGLFRSDDAGQTWKRVNNSWDIRQRSYYYTTVYVDPKDPNTIYLPTPTLYASYDGGKTLKTLRPPHGDNHIVWINPDNPQILVEGNDGGPTVSTTGGKTWSGERDLMTGQFYHINLDDEFPFHVYSAQQDEGASEGPSAVPGGIRLADWIRTAGGEATWSVPQPGKPWITYGSGYFSEFTKLDSRTGVTQSVSPWPDWEQGVASERLKYRSAWTHPILFSPANPQELLVGYQYVLKSMDFGATWTRISPDLTRNDKSTEGPAGGPVMLDQTGAEVYPYISGLAVSPLSNNVIWAGSSDGLVHVTTDGGQHWENVTPPKFKDTRGWVWSVAASPSDQGTAYVAINRYRWGDHAPYVYRTTDFGKHWTSIVNGIPATQYAWSVAIDPNDSNLVFLGTSSTVYVSLNAGNTWESLTLNLPVAWVRDIAIQPQQNSVVIATHGRAIWVLDNLGLLEHLAHGVQVASNASYLFAPQTTWMTKSYGGRSFGGPDPSVGANHPFGTTVFFHLPADYNGTTPVSLDFTTTSGQVIRSYKLHLAKSGEKPDMKATAVSPGMNRFLWDLRYPGAIGITGYYLSPIATNGYDPDRPGPEILPGTYNAVLHYGEHTQQTSFVVKLDPRLTTTQSQLEARQKLLFEIQGTIDDLAKAVNAGLAVQTKLEHASASRSDSARYQGQLSAVENAIGVLAQMHVGHGGVESDAAVPLALRAAITFLYQDVARAYVQPTVAQQDVYDWDRTQIQKGIANLKTAVSNANAALVK